MESRSPPADQVVVLLARLVVEQRATLRRLADRVGRHAPAPAREGRQHHGQLEHVQRDPRVAVRHAGDRAERLGGRLRMELGEPPLAVRERPPHDRQQVVLLEPAQNVDAAAREQRGVHLEGRILGRGADEDDRALLDVGEKRILLGAVEPMDLVDEEDGPHPVTGALAVGLADHLADLLDARQDGREGDEAGAGHAGHQGRERGLAGARGAPEDHRMQLARLDGRPQHAAGPQEVLLPHDLVDRARSDAIGQRRGRPRGGRAALGLAEKLHASAARGLEPRARPGGAPDP